MWRLPTLLALTSILFMIACTSSPDQGTFLAEKEEALQKKEQELLAREQAIEEQEQLLLEKNQAQAAKPDTLSSASEKEDPAAAEIEHPIRPGKHGLTLQWISWDIPGTVMVSFEETGLYKVVGEQKSTENDDFLRIDGTLSPVSEREFLFQGKIEYRVSYNNGGEVCIKTGPLHFKASGKRKYWRLQEKTNCEGGMLTDYIDIYF